MQTKRCCTTPVESHMVLSQITRSSKLWETTQNGNTNPKLDAKPKEAVTPILQKVSKEKHQVEVMMASGSIYNDDEDSNGSIGFDVNDDEKIQPEEENGSQEDHL